MALQLHPWRDGYIKTRNKLESESSFEASTVYVTFQEDEFVEYLQEDDAIALFTAIGSRLPHLESVIVSLDVTSILPSLAIPPIQALTSLLVAENTNKLKYLTLLHLQLEGNDLDMNGMIEAIRIHPSLHSIVIKNCKFSSNRHIKLLRNTLTSREEMKHCNLLDNYVVLAEHTMSRRIVRPFAFLCFATLVAIVVHLRLVQEGTNYQVFSTNLLDYLPARMSHHHVVSKKSERRKWKWRRRKRMA
eukprot:scaffold674_cov126-Cylindrotheca_fusiformis.AAC.26